MTSNVKACMPSEIYKLLPEVGLDLTKHVNTLSHFQKKMVVNSYANHVLSILKCMPQHFIHTMYCYTNLYYKQYTKYKYILFITTLPNRITQKHVITSTVKCPNMENETV